LRSQATFKIQHYATAVDQRLACPTVSAYLRSTEPLKDRVLRRLCADIVPKVENRTTLKLSQTSIFSRLYHCNTE
jgi:hypothetical protein